MSYRLFHICCHGASRNPGLCGLISVLNEFLREGWGKQEGGSQSLEKRNTYLLYPEVFCSHPCVIQVQKYLVGFHSRSHKLEEKTVVRTIVPVNLSGLHKRHT